MKNSIHLPVSLTDDHKAENITKTKILLPTDVTDSNDRIKKQNKLLLKNSGRDMQNFSEWSRIDHLVSPVKVRTSNEMRQNGSIQIPNQDQLQANQSMDQTSIFEREMNPLNLNSKTSLNHDVESSSMVLRTKGKFVNGTVQLSELEANQNMYLNSFNVMNQVGTDQRGNGYRLNEMRSHRYKPSVTNNIDTKRMNVDRPRLNSSNEIYLSKTPIQRSQIEIENSTSRYPFSTPVRKDKNVNEMGTRFGEMNLNNVVPFHPKQTTLNSSNKGVNLNGSDVSKSCIDKESNEYLDLINRLSSAVNNT